MIPKGIQLRDLAVFKVFPVGMQQRFDGLHLATVFSDTNLRSIPPKIAKNDLKCQKYMLDFTHTTNKKCWKLCKNLLQPIAFIAERMIPTGIFITDITEYYRILRKSYHGIITEY